MQNLSRCFKAWTGRAWFIEVSQEQGQLTLQQKRDQAAAERREAALAHPLVQRTLEAFPGAKVADVRSARGDFGLELAEKATTVPDDYLSYDYQEDGFDPESFDPGDTDEDYI